MDEAEWLACADPKVMLEVLSGHASERKLRLFAVWCCRSIWRPMRKRRSRKVVEVAERYVDGLADVEALDTAHAAAYAAFDEAPHNTIEQITTAVASDVALEDPVEACCSAIDAADVIAYFAVYSDDSIESTDATEADYKARRLTERATQCRALRCVMNNPFRPATLDPVCRTPAVVALARTAYDERELPSGNLDPVLLAVLADALEEAGADQALLEHLRGPGPHLRGCHAVDLCLGRGWPAAQDLLVSRDFT